MELILLKTHKLVGDGYFLGRTGENEAETLEITIKDTSLLDKEAYIEFELNDGTKYTTPRITINGDLISYAIPNGILQQGKVKIQVILRDATGFIWKSYTREFAVDSSINAGEQLAEEYPDFITEAQKTLDETVTAKEGMENTAKELITRVEAVEESNKAVVEGEAARVEAETQRLEDETKRLEAEAARVEAEPLRIANETARVEAEALRVENENLRLKNETQRSILNKLYENMFAANEGKTFNNVVKESIAYMQGVPSNSLPNAIINKVGGMCYTSKNLLNVSEALDVDGVTKEENGFTVYGVRTLYNSEWVQEHLKPSTQYYVKYKITKLTEPEGEIVSTSQDKGLYLTGSNGFIPPLTYSGAMNVGDTYEYKGTFTTPEDLTGWLLKSKTEYWKLDTTNYDYATFKIENIIISEEDIPYEEYYYGFKRSKVTKIKGFNDKIIIPETIVNRSDYGLGIDENNYNYIDFERGVFVIKVAIRAYQEGDENIEGYLVNNTKTATIYPLESQGEAQLSSLQGINVVKVNSNGVITFENENSQAVPSEVTYQVKI